MFEFWCDVPSQNQTFIYLFIYFNIEHLPNQMAAQSYSTKCVNGFTFLVDLLVTINFMPQSYITNKFLSFEESPQSAYYLLTLTQYKGHKKSIVSILYYY